VACLFWEGTGGGRESLGQWLAADLQTGDENHCCPQSSQLSHWVHSILSLRHVVNEAKLQAARGGIWRR